MLMPRLYGENLFDGFFNDFFDFDFPTFDDRPMRQAQRKLYGHHAENMMKTDVRERDDHYELAVELPGFKKEELSLELEQGHLVITARKGLDQDTPAPEEGRYIRRERFVGTMSRSFYVGDNVTEEEIGARYEDGVLTLTIPKKVNQPQLPQKKVIAIE
ncbi:MAG: Hsp20/alpha crystallin family protein [Oscillospiraceae bacterium]|nr:Hsp20/alpha crystallin family protein [Oscillospiraceae bacterium]